MTVATSAFAVALLLLAPALAPPGTGAALPPPDPGALCRSVLPANLCELLGFEEPPPPGHVHMVDFTFDLQSTTIGAGDTITWHNHDGFVHTATSSANPPVFDSGDVANGGTFQFTFGTPGTYEYYCLYHVQSGMTGTIVVEA